MTGKREKYWDKHKVETILTLLYFSGAVFLVPGFFIEGSIFYKHTGAILIGWVCTLGFFANEFSILMWKVERRYR